MAVCRLMATQYTVLMRLGTRKETSLTGIYQSPSCCCHGTLGFLPPHLNTPVLAWQLPGSLAPNPPSVPGSRHFSHHRGWRLAPGWAHWVHTWCSSCLFLAAPVSSLSWEGESTPVQKQQQRLKVWGLPGGVWSTPQDSLNFGRLQESS